MRMVGIRGLIVGRGDDDISVRVQGPDLDTLADIGDDVLLRLTGIEGLGNLQHSSEDVLQELAVVLDRERAAALGYSVEVVGRAVRIALQGVVVTDFIDGDRQYDVRMRLPRTEVASPRDVESILLFPQTAEQAAVYLGDVAEVDIVTAPADIRRDRQRRIIEISGTVTGERSLGEVNADVGARLAGVELPPGYTIYDESAGRALREGEQLAWLLMALAVFLVFVVMAVQYESLRNPLVIMFSVPFATIGVAAGLHLTAMPLSMPMWLGMIMLAGIVVNNAIVLVEYIELERGRGRLLEQAVIEAGRLRLRPILMTTTTTVVGMTPLALGIGEGSEMLQPLALTIVWGLLFSSLVSLLLVPAVYRIVGRRDPEPVMERSEGDDRRDDAVLGTLRPQG
jgi:multidrug efflux pump subunit AcrB